LQQPTGLWTNVFTYDATKRLESVTSPAGSFTYTHTGAGNLWTNLALPNGRWSPGAQRCARMKPENIQQPTFDIDRPTQRISLDVEYLMLLGVRK
jgi:uncharacterized protein RhaS with RHS repeats